MNPIENIPDYDGIGIYAIIDDYSNKKYIGSSIHIKSRIIQHNSSIKNGKGNKGLCKAYEQGHKLYCEIIEKIDYGINKFYLSEREIFYIKKFDTIKNGFNIHPTPSCTEKQLESDLKMFKNNSVMYQYILDLIKSKSEPILEAQKKSRDKWDKENMITLGCKVKKTEAVAFKEYAKAYDELKVRVQKGQKEVIKAHADRRGESLNGFIKRAIDETIQRESGEE